VQDNNKTDSTISEMEKKELPQWVKRCAELSMGTASSGDQIRDRAFHLIGGTVMFGICMAELEDSFLVGLPAVLVADGNTVEGREFSASNIIRLMRSSIIYMNIPENPYKMYYFKFLMKNFDEIPDFFEKDRRDIITNFVHNYESRPKEPDVEGFEEIDIIDHENAGASPDSFWSSHNSKEIH
jgi:hypothetical protein